MVKENWIERWNSNFILVGPTNLWAYLQRWGASLLKSCSLPLSEFGEGEFKLFHFYRQVEDTSRRNFVRKSRYGICDITKRTRPTTIHTNWRLYQIHNELNSTGHWPHRVSWWADPESFWQPIRKCSCFNRRLQREALKSPGRTPRMRPLSWWLMLKIIFMNFIWILIVIY